MPTVSIAIYEYGCSTPLNRLIDNSYFAVEMTGYKLLLADDDSDDCTFFREALDDLQMNTTLTTVNDGVELMHHLSTTQESLPDILFLDLNMPRKTGFDCLSEIKASEKLKNIPIIVFSTSSNHQVVDKLYENGALYYIRKPGEFSKLKKVIQDGINQATTNTTQPVKEKFML